MMKLKLMEMMAMTMTMNPQLAASLRLADAGLKVLSMKLQSLLALAATAAAGESLKPPDLLEHQHASDGALPACRFAA